MKPTYNFPALRGIQASREYYLAMCPLKLVSKLFLYDEVGVPAELRAQRILNKARVPEIANYITDNPKEYVFSALTASIDANVEFTPLDDEIDKSLNIGSLTIPMDATIIINDGQHRRAAIDEALKKRPELADESIAIVFFIDAGLRRSQQMFADLNKHAVRPSQSLGVLYEHREPLAELVRQLSEKVEVFKGLTEKEKTSISNRSIKLFTLSGIYQATEELLRKKREDTITDEEKGLAYQFWTEIAKVIPEWGMASRKEISCAALREEFIHAHGVAIQALGIAGSELLAQYPTDWKGKLSALRAIDWSRHNSTVWEGRAMFQGRINKAQRQVSLTANYLKSILELSLTPDEQVIEDKFISDYGVKL
jgi:DNA sulfur modification protein DndB